MRKNILMAISACALVSGLASCGGIKNTFSLAVDDPVLSYSQASKGGFKIRFAEGYKFVETPKYENMKFSESTGKMKFELGDFSQDNPSRDYWYATVSEPGTYKVSMTVDGVKSANELVLTVKEGQFAPTDFTIPNNIHISYKSGNDNFEFYKIGDAVVRCINTTPVRYIPNIKAEKGVYYIDNKTGEWESTPRDRECGAAYQSAISNFKVGVTREYDSAGNKTVTISGVTYNTVNYIYGDASYERINNSDLALVVRSTVPNILGYDNGIEVTAFDFAITSFPESFKLPK